MAALMKGCEYYIHFFGYAKDERATTTDKEDNKYPFYDYQGKADSKNADVFEQFKGINQKMLELRVKQKKSGTFASIPVNHGLEGM